MIPAPAAAAKNISNAAGAELETKVALLRGVNVGGKNRLLMKDLRDVLVANGFCKVTTVLQSGNIVFTSAEKDSGKRIAQLILEHFQLNIPVVVYPQQKLSAILKANPFPEERTYVTFLSGIPEPAALDACRAVDGKGDSFQVAGSTIYLDIRGAYHETVFSNAFWERQLQLSATTRNYRTLQKMVVTE